ncbi:MAG TPA: 50S ribosomal protein L19 [Candidatus Saccharimonadia bacterium]|nr:50S ribosomal protein L19 [Candidatus Saccharimonadia bacterium]
MEAIRQLEKTYRKPALASVQTGDTVRVHQLIKEGNKQRIQVFEGVIIRRHRMNEVSACITVRRIASGVGVEKTFLMHSPNVSKVEIMRRAKVRRNFLSFLRRRRGKSARLKEVTFDKAAANSVAVPEVEVPTEETTPDAPAEVIEVEENQDALNDAAPLSDVEKAEEKAAGTEDSVETDADASGDREPGDQQSAEVEETNEGLDRAEPGEGEAVHS